MSRDDCRYAVGGVCVPTVLLVNKVDLCQEPGAGQSDIDLSSFCRQVGINNWYRTSARDGTNVEEAVAALVREVLDRDNWSQYRSVTVVVYRLIG